MCCSVRDHHKGLHTPFSSHKLTRRSQATIMCVLFATNICSEVLPCSMGLSFGLFLWHFCRGLVDLQARSLGFTTCEVNMKGMGFGKQRAVRALHGAGLMITAIHEKTPVAHNGCRRPRKRRG